MNIKTLDTKTLPIKKRDIKNLEVEKQREIIRLWNLMRRVEGPIAEEIRIQILDYFAERDRGKRAA